MSDINTDIQKRIDAIQWYHEFEFPGGFKAGPVTHDSDAHRRLWRFIQQNLDGIDFAGKTVLDIGCWDGYWSFYAERRGASHVLATDDASQNWAGSKGLVLAKELLKSNVETNLGVSVYELEKLSKRFDIVLCLGVYYHLIDPFFAFAQIRHVCHENTVVVLEGDVTDGLRPNTSHFDFSDPALPTFVPGKDNLDMMLRAAYLAPQSQSLLDAMKPLHWRRRLRISTDTIYGKYGRLPHRLTRAVTVCRPFRGTNSLHAYKPPFGLHRYDDRFSSD